MVEKMFLLLSGISIKDSENSVKSGNCHGDL